MVSVRLSVRRLVLFLFLLFVPPHRRPSVSLARSVHRAVVSLSRCLLLTLEVIRDPRAEVPECRAERTSCGESLLATAEHRPGRGRRAGHRLLHEFSYRGAGLRLIYGSARAGLSLIHGSASAGLSLIHGSVAIEEMGSG